MPNSSRRRFLKAAAAAAVVAPYGSRILSAAESKLHIACNQFCWINMYRRRGKDFNSQLDAGFADVKRSGMDGVEAMLGTVAAAEQIVPLLNKQGLGMRSFYTGATMHEAESVTASIDRVVATTARAKQLIDVKIVVVNPTPLHGQAKTDDQLATQADGMNRLGRKLAAMGVTLAYHFHAPAWQDEGREFYHVLNNTAPEAMGLCLDTHWVFRGAGDNVQKVYEVVKQYGSRVAELHLRQSKAGIWTEAMSDGDIDYRKVAASLLSQGVRPLLVLEQAVEKGTPDTMDAVESHRRSREYVQEVFAAMG